MKHPTLTLVVASLCVSYVLTNAQDRTTAAERFAAQAQAALAEAPRLPLEKMSITIQLPAGWELGRISAVAMGPDNTAYVLQRGTKADMILVVDQTGRVLRSWGKGLFGIPHSIKVDPAGNVWATDAGNGQIVKFSPDGKTLQEIPLEDAPKGQECSFPSAAVNNFVDACGTTDIIFLPDRLYLTDGYGKMRVLEYGLDGKRVRVWGGAGEGQSQFRVPHGLAYDGKVLFVADRDNGRVQRFEKDGKYLDEWTHLGRVGSLDFEQGMLWGATGVRLPASGDTPARNQSWIIKVDPASGKILGKTEVTNGDFIDVAPNGEVIAGATAGVFTWYKPSR